MFDCLVSLKKGYRYVFVNSIWFLKVLDYYVIFDEEIIQNWRFLERFKTFSFSLFFNFYLVLIKVIYLTVFFLKLVQRYKSLVYNFIFKYMICLIILFCIFYKIFIGENISNDFIVDNL